ncbi:hypothetical protein Hdeb2414_s0004g00137531 [Helianthus debilis subsp. tardiflorus]
MFSAALVSKVIRGLGNVTLAWTSHRYVPVKTMVLHLVFKLE